MAGCGEYTGGVAAGQLWASVIRVLGMLEGSGPVGKGLSIPRGRWPEELREKGAVTKSQPWQEVTLVAEGVYLFSVYTSSSMRTSLGSVSFFMG